MYACEGISRGDPRVRDNKIINHKLFKFVIKKRFVASFDTFFRTHSAKRQRAEDHKKASNGDDYERLKFHRT